MTGQPWWVTLAAAVITAGAPTFGAWVLYRQGQQNAKDLAATRAALGNELGVVHKAVNSTASENVEALKEARQEIADLREIVGKLKEREAL